VIAGSNERLRRRLTKTDWPVPVTVLGFTRDVALWMAAADVLLTKAGSGAIAEAACVGVTTLLTGFVPGQEEGNVAWARESGAAVFEPRPKRAAALVERWLGPDRSELLELAARMRAVGRPEASRSIADAALGLLSR